jgi:hypothetical protein
MQRVRAYVRILFVQPRGTLFLQSAEAIPEAITEAITEAAIGDARISPERLPPMEAPEEESTVCLLL